MLQRHVQILHGLRFFGHYIKKNIADVRGISVHYAHPLDSFRVRQLAQQMSKSILLAEVFTITRRVLRDEDQFLHAFFRKLMSFGDDGSESPAAKVPAHLRNEAEGARTIAAFGNLDEGVMRRRGKYPGG